MQNPGWVNVQVRHCPVCREEYRRQEVKCPRCGHVLEDKTLRAPAQES